MDSFLLILSQKFIFSLEHFVAPPRWIQSANLTILTCISALLLSKVRATYVQEVAYLDSRSGNQESCSVIHRQAVDKHQSLDKRLIHMLVETE